MSHLWRESLCGRNRGTLADSQNSHPRHVREAFVDPPAPSTCQLDQEAPCVLEEQPRQPTELRKIRNHCYLKTLCFGVSCYPAVDNKHRHNHLNTPLYSPKTSPGSTPTQDPLHNKKEQKILQTDPEGLENSRGPSVLTC